MVVKAQTLSKPRQDLDEDREGVWGLRAGQIGERTTKR